MPEFDLAVIGAGILGAVSAYLACQQQPEWRVLLLDRSLVGDGATQYSAGLDIPYGRNARQKHYSTISTGIYRDLKASIPELPIYQIPLFSVVAKDKEKGLCSGFTTEGIRPATKPELAQLHKSYPGLAIPEDQIVLTGCMAHYAFPVQVAQLLVRRLKETGRAECWEGVEIDGVQPTGEGFKLATNDGRNISARRVLVATGPWLLDGPASEFARNAGVRIKKVAALHINRPPAPQDPVIIFFDEDAFLLPVVQRREWIFSFTSEEWDCVPEVSRLRISKADRELALKILDRYCPSFVHDCHGGRVFCDAYTPDRIPLVAQVADVPNFVVAGACSGSGYRLAPGIGVEALSKLA
ncbi:MAG TPA: FAD-binding oxidoreductase [Pyrinomonadaceae bacterium]